MTLRSAFANSVNSVAVQLADDVGIKGVIEVARKLGVRSDLPNVPSLALGNRRREPARDDPGLCGDWRPMWKRSSPISCARSRKASRRSLPARPPRRSPPAIRRRAPP